MTANNHRPAGSGDGRPVSAAAPDSARAREGAAQPTPRARTDPRPFPAEALALVVTLALPPRFRLRHSASSALDRCAGSARAWREPLGERP